MSSIYTVTPTNPLYNVVKNLRSLRLESLEESLQRVVGEEAEALLNYPHTRRTVARQRSAFEAACGSYAELIEGFLQTPHSITPHDILHYRCKANAWAIARLIQSACDDIPFG